MTLPNRNLRLVFIIAISFVFSLSIFSYIKINSLIESSALVNHTNQVTLGLEKVIGTLKDAETAHRGYLLTHDKTFLDPFTKALKEYPENINAVKQITIDNPEQQKAIEKIERLAQHREDYLIKMLEIDKLRTPTPAELLIGKSIMDSLRNEVNAMISIENILMGQRSKELQKQTMMAPALLLSLSVIALVILIISYLQLNKSLLQAQQLKDEKLKQAVLLERSKETRDSEKRFNLMLMKSPFCFAVVKGEDLVITLANTAVKELWAKGNDIEGKRLLEILPELAGTGFPEILQNVITTGIPYYGYETLAQLNRNGKPEDCYFNFVYQPYYEADESISGVTIIAIEVTKEVLAKKQFQEADNRFRRMVNQAPVAICVLSNTNFVVELANEKQLQLWGKAKEEVYNIPVFTAVPEAAGQGFEELLSAVFTTGEPFIANESPVTLRRNGKNEVVYVNFVYEPLYDHEHKIDGVLAVTIDVTEQVLARKKIEESDEKLRSLIENAPFPIGVFAGKEMRIELANESIIKAWGKGNDVRGKLFKEVVPEVANQQIFEQLDAVFTSGVPFHAHNQYLTILIEGKEQSFYYNYSFTPVFDSSGKVYGVMNTASDVTDLNLAKQRIEESEQDLRSMVLQAPIGICIVDASTLVCEIVNDSFIEIAGKPHEAIAGSHYWDAFAEARPFYESAFNKVVTEGTPFFAKEAEVMLIRHGVAEKMYLTFVYAPLKNEEGVVKKVAVWAMDNTPQVIARQKIEEADKRFRTTVKQAPVGMTILRGTEYIVEMANDAYLQLVDRKENEFIGRPLFDALPEVEETVHPLLDSVLNSGIPYHGSEVAIPLNRYGKLAIYYFDFLYYPLMDDDGKISGVIVTVTEVSEKVEVRKKIEDSEKRYNLMLMQSPFAFLILKGKDMVVHLANDSMKEVLGKGRDIEGKPLLEVLPEIKGQAFPDLLDKVYTTGIPFSANEMLAKLARNGKLENVYLNYVYQPYYEADNTIAGVTVIAYDVTSTVIANKQIEESEERFRSLAQTLPQLVWVTDAQGNAEFASCRWKEYTGIEPGGEREWKAVVHPDDYDNINNAWIHSLKTGNIYASEVRLKGKDGEYKWHAVKGEPVLDKENKIIKWVGAFTDIQNRKLQEEKKDEFISIASHEMKTPLTTAKAYLQMVELLTESDKDVNLYAKKANQSVNRLNELISELLDVSKIRLGKLDYTVSTFNFNDMIDETVQNMQLISPKHVIIKTGKVRDEFTGDRNRIQQVVINLMNNAIKYSPGTEKIYIKLDQEEGLIKVAIQDSGIGIAQHSINKIFDRYHRVEEHAGHFQGLGIGLFISREIIQRHHGKLWAESEPGKGSTFYFTIPIISNPIT